MLEEGQNKRVKSFVYETIEEAKTYQAQCGGTINYIRKYREEFQCENNDLDFGLDVECVDTKHIQEGKEYYVLNVSHTSVLKDGFRYIKELLLQEFHYKLNKDFNTLIDNGVDVFSVITDAFVVKKSDVDKAKSLIKFTSKIGGWRVSKTEKHNLPSDDFKMVMNKEIEIPEPKSERVEIRDEWDTTEICKVFEDKKRVMVRAEYAGCGKSYAASHMEKLGHKVLFVCPTNKLAINNQGVTMNKFFGFGATNDIKMAKFDDS